MKKIDNLIIIPCRKGSKGIKLKNFIKIKKKSLYEVSLNHALVIKKKFKSSEIVVSTDYNLKKNLTNFFTILRRPKSISQDKSKSFEYVLHAIKYYLNLNISFKNIIILQPTSPLRSNFDLISCIKIFNKKRANSLITVYEESYINSNVMYKKKGIYGLPLNKKHNKGEGRKKKNIVYVRKGSIYIVNLNYFLLTKKIISPKPLIYVMSKFNSLNINTKDDLEIYKKLKSIDLDKI